MAKDDEWCEFCNTKLKSTIVRRSGREWHVCRHCAYLTVEDTQGEGGQ